MTLDRWWLVFCIVFVTLAPPGRSQTLTNTSVWRDLESQQTSVLVGGKVLADAEAFMPRPYQTDVASSCPTLSAVLATAFPCMLVNASRHSLDSNDVLLEHCSMRRPGAGLLIITQRQQLQEQQPQQQQQHRQVKKKRHQQHRRQLKQQQEQQQQPQQLQELPSSPPPLSPQPQPQPRPPPSPTEPDTRSAFRVRMVGPEVLLMDIYYCSGGIAIGTYSVTTSGLYHVEVLHLHDNFNFDVAAKLDGRNLHAVSFELALTFTSPDALPPPPSSPAAALNLSQPIIMPANTSGHMSQPIISANTSDSIAPPLVRRPVCAFDDAMRGRWVSSAPQELSALHASCLWHDNGHSVAQLSPVNLSVPACAVPNPQSRTMGVNLTTMIQQHNETLLRWRPDTCDLVTYDETPAGRAACRLDQRHYCFIGDSFTRLSFTTFVGQFGETGRDQWHARENDNKDYELWTDYARYDWLHKINGDADWLFQEPIANNLSRCTHMVVNFGYHTTHQKERQEPTWSMARYLHALTRVAERLAYLAKTRGVRVFWQDTTSAPLRSYYLRMRGRTTDPYTIIANGLAESVMRQAGIAIIRTWPIRATLVEMMDSSRHFPANGTVDFAVQRLLSHALCQSP